MEDELGCSVKSYAIAGLVTYGLTAVLFALTAKYPQFGTPSHTHGFTFRLPPQAFFAAMLGVFTLGIAVMIGLLCFRYSVASRQRVWLIVFAACIVVGLAGPALLFTGADLSPSTGGVVAVIWALDILLILLASLLYSVRSPVA